MEKKKSFIFYKDWLQPIMDLSLENAGKLFKYILEFVNDIEPCVDEELKPLYYSITEQIVFEWSKFNPKTQRYHWNYKGGISPKNKIIRNSNAYKYWRKNVFDRDLHTCQNCKEKGGILNAHHIKHFSKYPELRFELSNGITLCRKCHIEVHSTKNKKNG